MTPDPLRLRELLARLTEAEVRFVLVGGLAVNAWGYLRATRDVDVVPDPFPENLERLDVLLRDLGGKVDVDGRLLEEGASPSFAALDEKAKDVDLDGLVVRVCSLEQLLEMKRSSSRPRDREDLEALAAAQDPGEVGG